MHVPSGMPERTVGEHNKWAALAVCCLALFMVTLDNLIVNVAIPHISLDLNPTTAQLQWIVSAYILVFASLQITAGGLGDRLGRKRFFIAGIGIFTLTSLLAGFSQNTEMLIAARALMGIGGAFIMPLSLSIVTAAFPPEERGKAIGAWSGISFSGLAIGPIIGGLIVENFSWHWIFGVNVPIGIIAVLLSMRILKESQDRTGHASTDIPGTVVITGAIASLTWGLIEAGTRGWTDALILGAFVLAATLIGIFIIVEQRIEYPMVPMEFFKRRNFTASNIVSLGVSFLISGVAFAMTLYWQNVHGFSAVRAGLTLLPTIIPMIIVGAIAGSMVNRLGAKWMIPIGMLLSAGGIYMLSQISWDAKFMDAVPAYVVFGLGNGLIFAPMTTILMNSVPTAKAGVASAVNGAIRETGFAFGVALLGTIMNRVYRDNLAADAQFTGATGAIRSQTQDPGMLRLLDSIANDINAGGRVIREAAGGVLPPDVVSAIQVASSKAFTAGMERGYVIAAVSTVAMAVIAWLLIQREDAQAEEPVSATSPAEEAPMSVPGPYIADPVMESGD